MSARGDFGWLGSESRLFHVKRPAVRAFHVKHSAPR